MYACTHRAVGVGTGGVEDHEDEVRRLGHGYHLHKRTRTLHARTQTDNTPVFVPCDQVPFRTSANTRSRQGLQSHMHKLLCACVHAQQEVRMGEETETRNHRMLALKFAISRAPPLPPLRARFFGRFHLPQLHLERPYNHLRSCAVPVETVPVARGRGPRLRRR